MEWVRVLGRTCHDVHYSFMQVLFLWVGGIGGSYITHRCTVVESRQTRGLYITQDNDRKGQDRARDEDCRRGDLRACVKGKECSDYDEEEAQV